MFPNLKHNHILSLDQVVAAVIAPCVSAYYRWAVRRFLESQGGRIWSNLLNIKSKVGYIYYLLNQTVLRELWCYLTVSPHSVETELLNLLKCHQTNLFSTMRFKDFQKCVKFSNSAHLLYIFCHGFSPLIDFSSADTSYFGLYLI